MNKILKSIFYTHKRCISTTSFMCGKKNFRKFYIPNKRGTRQFKEAQRASPHPEIPIDKRGVRDTGIKHKDGTFEVIMERIPQLIVPDLEGCKYQPYVSYRTPKIEQSAFTAEDLFNGVYAKKIVEDWNNKKLNEDGSPKEPSEDELLTPEEALNRAKKTGTDMF